MKTHAIGQLGHTLSDELKPYPIGGMEGIETMDNLIEKYIAAFFAANGYEPTVTLSNNGRYAVTNRAGSFDRYTAGDIRHMTGALARIASISNGGRN